MLQIEVATGEMRTSLEKMILTLRKMMGEVVQVLETGDQDLMHSIMEQDQTVDGIYRNLDRQAAELLALINPMASDFRFVFAVLKMNVDVERIGDQCKNVVKDIQRAPEKSASLSQELKDMGKKVYEVLDLAFQSLEKRKTDLARDVLKHDAEVDAMELVIMNKLGCSLPETMIARSLERIADHATNICENLVYAIEGQDVRDLREQYKISAK